MCDISKVETILQCPLCYTWLHEPVTVGCCGTTYCKECLLRTYDFCNGNLPRCPYCREILPFQSDLRMNKVLTDLIQVLVPSNAQKKRQELDRIAIGDLATQDPFIPSPLNESINYYQDFERRAAYETRTFQSNDLFVVPLFGLDSIAYPGIPLALHVFEPRYRLMIRRCLKGSRRFGVANISQISKGEVIGTLCRIDRTAMFDDGRILIITFAEKRFEIKADSLHNQDGYNCASVTWFNDDPQSNEALRESMIICEYLHLSISRFLIQLSQTNNRIFEIVREKFGPMPLATDIQAMSFWCSAFLSGEISRGISVQLLSTSSTLERLRKLKSIVSDRFPSAEVQPTVVVNNDVSTHAQ